MVSHPMSKGVAVQGSVPNWGPLLSVVGEEVAERFMWMFEVRLADGRRLDAYKHCVTRGYLHLDRHGDAFYAGAGGYGRIELWRLLHAVLAPWWEEDLSGGGRDDIAAAKRAVRRARSRS